MPNKRLKCFPRSRVSAGLPVCWLLLCYATTVRSIFYLLAQLKVIQSTNENKSLFSTCFLLLALLFELFRSDIAVCVSRDY
jgi:hypothetical protein